MENKKFNGFNDGISPSSGVGGRPSYFEQMSNKDQNAQGSDTTESDSINVDGKQNLEALREKFFKDWCLRNQIGIDITEKVFNWFIPYLKQSL